MLDKLFQLGEYKEKDHQYIEEIITDYLEPESFEKELLELAEFIRPYVEDDPSQFYTLEEFENSFKDEFIGQESVAGSEDYSIATSICWQRS